MRRKTTIRCFIATGLENEDIRSQITQLQQQLPKKGITLVNPNILHFTLKFLGEISETQVKTVKTILQQVPITPFDIHFANIGMFPSLSKPRVVWVGVEQGKTEMCALAEAVVTALEREGFPAEEKFKPHLTIARVKFLTDESKVALRQFFTHNQNSELGTQRVSAITLKESILTPQGPEYTTLARYPHE